MGWAHGCIYLQEPHQLFIGFSWTGISFYNTIENKTLLIGVATLAELDLSIYFS